MRERWMELRKTMGKILAILPKKVCASLLIFMAIGGVIFAYIHFNEGFTIRAILSSLPYDQSYRYPPLDPSTQEVLDTVFDKPVHYLGKGIQCYAFESSCGRYVVKFFKHKHLRPLSPLRTIPYFGKVLEGRIAAREKRIERLLTSCALSYAELKEEAALLLVHLHRVPHVKRRLTLIDSLGFSHTISLDDHEFIIQRKGVTLAEAFATQDHAQIRLYLDSLIALIKHRLTKGIKDNDPSFVKNVAFLSPTHPFFVDIGQFTKEHITPEDTTQDIHHRLLELRYWMTGHYPSLLSLIDEEINRSVLQERVSHPR